jgi:hypothetical protein
VAGIAKRVLRKQKNNPKHTSGECSVIYEVLLA